MKNRPKSVSTSVCSFYDVSARSPDRLAFFELGIGNEELGIEMAWLRRDGVARPYSVRGSC